jgi:hypothetical protein
MDDLRAEVGQIGVRAENIDRVGDRAKAAGPRRVITDGVVENNGVLFGAAYWA